MQAHDEAGAPWRPWSCCRRRSGETEGLLDDHEKGQRQALADPEASATASTEAPRRGSRRDSARRDSRRDSALARAAVETSPRRARCSVEEDGTILLPTRHDAPLDPLSPKAGTSTPRDEAARRLSNRVQSESSEDENAGNVSLAEASRILVNRGDAADPDAKEDSESDSETDSTDAGSAFRNLKSADRPAHAKQEEPQTRRACDSAAVGFGFEPTTRRACDSGGLSLSFGDGGGAEEEPQTRRNTDSRACGFGAGADDGGDGDEDEDEEDESEDVPTERFCRSEEKRFLPRVPTGNILDLAEAEPSEEAAGLALIPIVSRRGGEEAQAPRAAPPQKNWRTRRQRTVTFSDDIVDEVA